MGQKRFLEGRVIIRIADITEEEVDAIVNAANATLLGGGGVDGAIHQAGGKTILEQCKAIRQNQYPEGLPTGKAVITTGGNLKAGFVIHTVGPIYGIDRANQAWQLAECYRTSLQLAVSHRLETIAFPAISTGAFSYPRAEAAKIASETIKDFLQKDRQIKEIRLVFFDESGAQDFIRYQVF